MAALGANGGRAKFARRDTVFPGLYSDGGIWLWAGFASAGALEIG